MKKKSFTPKKEFLTVGVRLTVECYEQLQQILKMENKTFSQWVRSQIETESAVMLLGAIGKRGKK